MVGNMKVNMKKIKNMEPVYFNGILFITYAKNIYTVIDFFKFFSLLKIYEKLLI